jgi:23S rRNA (adenine2030-N6)-methyltransferase
MRIFFSTIYETFMLSYQHQYHAGSFADVIKHCILTHILQYLITKDKPLVYLETHAGRGLYDLKDKAAQKTEEFKKGIALLWPNRHALPLSFKPYIQAIENINPDGLLRYYPGSPHLALTTLRSMDRSVFFELHPREFLALSVLPHRGNRVYFNQSDGLEGLKALLPPPEKRGFIFIDPTFECKEEYKTIPVILKNAYKRFATGVFCLWYPVVDMKLSQRVIRGMKDISSRYLHLEFLLNRKDNPGMYGCGLFIINPPFGLEKIVREILNTLKVVYNAKGASYILESKEG